MNVCTNSSDHVEGEAKIAERNAHFDDDGVIDKHEKKEIEKARKRQLESRGRGPAQIKAYRSGKWMLRVSDLTTALTSGYQGSSRARQQDKRT